jgi:uroporphyrinogen decarboxylase
LIGPDLFDRFVAPRLRRLVALAHGHGVAVMFHSCGAIVPLIDRLIDLGIDVLDPLQAAAKDMEPALLKQRFGARLCLHGGIDTQHLLPHGSPEDVRREVRRRSAILGAGGGYILAPCHVLQTDVPTANVLAMYETGWENGRANR